MTMMRSQLVLLMLLLVDYECIVVAIKPRQQQQHRAAFVVAAASTTRRKNAVARERRPRDRAPEGEEEDDDNDGDACLLHDNLHRKQHGDLDNHVVTRRYPSLPLLELRGGSSNEGDDDDDTNDGTDESTTRNNTNLIVRSLLSSTSGILHNVIRSVCQFFGWMEVTTRIDIEPSSSVTKKSSSSETNKKKRKRKISQTTTNMDDDLVKQQPQDGQKASSKKKKKGPRAGDRRRNSSSSSSTTTSAVVTSATKKKMANSPNNNNDNNNNDNNTIQKKKTKKKNPNHDSAHLKTTLKVTNPNYRIQQELRNFLSDPPEHLSVKVGKNIRVWIVTMQGVGIYQGERFTLRIAFPVKYPTVPPSVYFTGNVIPQHEHVYTNGDICLSLLGKDWRPNMTAQSIAISILSILGSASHKSLPMDNSRHAQNQPGQYQQDWVYHDDLC